MLGNASTRVVVARCEYCSQTKQPYPTVSQLVWGVPLYLYLSLPPSLSLSLSNYLSISLCFFYFSLSFSFSFSLSFYCSSSLSFSFAASFSFSLSFSFSSSSSFSDSFFLVFSIFVSLNSVRSSPVYKSTNKAHRKTYVFVSIVAKKTCSN